MSKYGIKVNEEIFDAYAESGRFVFLFDAFDEVDPSICQEALSQIEYLAEKYHEKLQIIITSRPNSDIQHSSNFRICKLVPLKNSDHLPFLRKIYTEKKQAEDLAKVILSSPTEVKDLLTTPLMLTLLVILYKAVQTVPDTVPRFYEELFDVLFYRHDHSKPGFRRKRHTSLDDSTIRSVFSAFCFYVRLKNYGTISMKELEECCTLACRAEGVTVDPKKFKDEIVKTVCLMQEEGFEFSFIHKSVAEYYAASFIKDSSDKFSTKFYTHATSPSKAEEWALEIKFLSQIDKYRHAKNFTLVLLDSLEREYSISIKKEISDIDMNKIIEIYSKNSSLIFIDAEDGKFNTCGWQRKCYSNVFFEESYNILLRTFSTDINSFNIEKKFLQPAMDPPQSEANKYCVSAENCTEIFPTATTKQATENARNFLTNLRKTAWEIVAREEAKAEEIDHLLQLD